MQLNSSLVYNMFITCHTPFLSQGEAELQWSTSFGSIRSHIQYSRVPFLQNMFAVTSKPYKSSVQDYITIGKCHTDTVRWTLPGVVQTAALHVWYRSPAWSEWLLYVAAWEHGSCLEVKHLFQTLFAYGICSNSCAPCWVSSGAWMSDQGHKYICAQGMAVNLGIVNKSGV